MILICVTVIKLLSFNLNPILLYSALWSWFWEMQTTFVLYQLAPYSALPVGCLTGDCTTGEGRGDVSCLLSPPYSYQHCPNLVILPQAVPVCSSNNKWISFAAPAGCSLILSPSQHTLSRSGIQVKQLSTSLQTLNQLNSALSSLVSALKGFSTMC